MKKTFVLQDLECAACAAKMERSIAKLEGVSSARVNFLTQSVTIEGADDRFDTIVSEAAAICRRIEPDCRLIKG